MRLLKCRTCNNMKVILEHSEVSLVSLKRVGLLLLLIWIGATLQSRAWDWYWPKESDNTAHQQSLPHNTSLQLKNLYNASEPNLPPSLANHPLVDNSAPTLRLKLYVVRHGQTEWNLAGLLQGHANTKLTAKGIADSLATGQELHNVTFKKIYCSDLKRTRHTLKLLGLEGTYDERLRGRNYAAFTGKHFVVYQTSKSQTVETNLQMTERWSNFFTDMISENKLDDQTHNILIVTHGGMVRNIAAHLQQYSKRGITTQKSRTLNSSISVFDLILRGGQIMGCDFVKVFGSEHLGASQH